jgi:hypothetical protein
VSKTSSVALKSGPGRRVSEQRLTERANAGGWTQVEVFHLVRWLPTPPRFDPGLIPPHPIRSIALADRDEEDDAARSDEVFRCREDRPV